MPFLGPLLQVKAGGAEICYRRFVFGYHRDPVPLVLLPGIGGTMAEWTAPFLQLLAHRREVIILDYAGQGLSQEVAPSQEPISTQQLVDSCLAFMDALELDRPNLLGFSLGGAVVLQMLSQAPEKVGKDCHLLRGPPEASAAWLRPEATLEDRAALFFPTETSAGKGAARVWVQEVAAMPPDPANPETTARMIEAFRPAFQSNPPWRPAASMDNPVLLMAGGLDLLVPPPNPHRLMCLIPGASLVLFPQGGHGFFWQAPNKTAAYIDTFLMPDE